MKTSRGFTLIEIAVVLVILAFLMTIGLRMTGALLEGQRRYTTRDRLNTIDAALVAFVSQVQRLPCPADGGLAPGDVNAGLEVRNGSGDCTSGTMANQVRGVVPWRTIGLSELDVTDGFYGLYTYRVGLGLTRNSAMNLVDCDPAGTGNAQGSAPYQSCKSGGGCGVGSLNACTSSQAIVAQRGLEVRDASSNKIADPNATPATGAAYVVVSAGPNRYGSYSPDGIVQAATTTNVSAGETQNVAGNALQNYYVDAIPSYNDDTSHFDDILSRPTILAVATKAALSPRPH